MNYAEILDFIRPGSERVIRGNSYEGIEWLDQNQIKPTQDECDAAQVALDALAYRDKRRAEYPPIGDQLDALWKGGQAATDMLAQVMAVKAKYPKPE